MNMQKELFHLHTYRCEHADGLKDEDFIEVAQEFGIKRLVYTDHAPFPGDKFFSRMKMEQLEDYLESLRTLKKEYPMLEIVIGLEIEYMPSFMEYYEYLKSIPDLELLMLGQHMCEIVPGKYNFDLEDRSQEYVYMAETMIEGMETGLFPIVAHPDRIFRGCGEWNPQLEELSRKIIETAKRMHIKLEENEGSKDQENGFRPEFWELVEQIGGVEVIHGLDAHSAEDARKRYKRILDMK